MTKTFEQILDDFLEERITPGELQQFLLAARQSDNENVLKNLILRKLESEFSRESIETHHLEEKFRAMLLKAENIEKGEAMVEQMPLNPPKSIFTIRRIAVAASIVFIIGLASWFLFFNNNRTSQNDGFVQTSKKNDVSPPESNRAMVTLADGRKVFLDSVVNGAMVLQNDIKLIKLADGQIAYESLSKNGNKTPVFNTLENPRGSRVIDVKLADGTHVWLNAASSLRFPTSFVGTERRVELTGEGYFEVAKNTSMPFRVSVAGKGEVEVLGTHFNINSYADEATINTTLLEGKVKVAGFATPSTAGNTRVLFPGEQAQITKEGAISVDKNVDLENVIAWKNGKFIFYNEDIHAVMRKLEKWYDLDVRFSGNATSELFVGIISRDVNISQILDMLEKTRTVSFEIRGKTIIVK